MLNQSAELFADKTAFLVKENRRGTYSPISYRRFADDVKALGKEFINMGLLKDTKIAIVSENRYFWGVTYMAAVNGESFVVPIDKELAAEDIINLLEVSGASAVVYSASVKSKLGNDFPKNIKYTINMDTATKRRYAF